MRAFLALIAVGVLPGLLLTGATHPAPGSLRTSERLLLAVVFSLGVALVGGLGLVQLELLTLPAIAAWIALASLALAVGAQRRGCHAAAIVARARDDLSTPTGLAAFAAIALTGMASAGRQLLDPTSFPHPAWNYLGDMLAMLSVAGLPASTLDYGVPFGFETNKIAWYLAGAEWLALGGLEQSPWLAVQVYVPAVATTFALSVWVFASTLFTRPATALLASVLLLSLPRVVYKVSGLRGEALALAVFFALATWMLRCLRPGRFRPGDGLVTAVCAATLALLHLVPAAVAGLFGACLATAQLLALRRAALPGLARLTGAAAMAALLVLGIWTVVPSSPLDSQAAIVSPEALGPYQGHDPTHAFGRLASGEVYAQTIMSYRDPATRVFTFHPLHVWRELLGRSALPHPAWPLEGPWWLAVAAIAAFWIVRRQTPEHLPLLGATALLLVALYGMGIWFSHRYHTFLPAVHPWRREFMYQQLFYALSLAAVVEAAGRAAAQRFGQNAGKGIAVVLALGLWLPLGWGAVQELRSPRAMARVDADGVAALSWLRSATPPDTRVLMDGSAVGLIGTLTGRTCITEGRAPYFQPANLRIALDTLAGARAFFADPYGQRAFLGKHEVDYVITGSAALGSRPFAAHPLRLDAEHFPIAAHFGSVVVHRARAAGVTRE